MTISVLAAVATNLQIILRFDRVAEAYIQAMRILEQAILEYEEADEEQYRGLLEANRKAEEIIHNLHQ